ncbi:hypothetical protein TEA_021604 [Camellia sinensis var. sinensis]|uniref:R13L1/DRL21-like LRR repeat region domain-containing protein n=1 Tax=Camellia sinensis var. sinensis TaxID=542762 RepID=A0A4S4ENM9_CAMSN|nr:hypothetical protein TEA_021604 [Camellia sinensis var. sinensis]
MRYKPECGCLLKVFLVLPVVYCWPLFVCFLFFVGLPFGVRLSENRNCVVLDIKNGFPKFEGRMRWVLSYLHSDVSAAANHNAVPQILGASFRHFIHSSSHKESYLHSDVSAAANHNAVPQILGASFRHFIHSSSHKEFETTRNSRSMNFVRGIIEEEGNGVMGSSQLSRYVVENNADIVHIKLLRNNTFVTVTDSKGNKKIGASSGCLSEMKGGPKLSRYAAEATAEHVGRLARNLGLKSVNLVYVRPLFSQLPTRVLNAANRSYLHSDVSAAANHNAVPQILGASFRHFIHSSSHKEFETARNSRSMNFVRGIIEEEGKGVMGSSQLSRYVVENNADIVHIKLLRNNTFVTVTDSKGNKKIGASSGCLSEMKGGPKLSRYAAEATAEHVGRLARNLGLKSVVMKVNGFTYFKKKKQAIVSFREGFTFSRESAQEHEVPKEPPKSLFEYCWKIQDMPPKLGQLTLLKRLSLFVVGKSRGCRAAELQCLDLGGELHILHLERVRNPTDAKEANLIGKQNLRIIKLSWGDNSESESQANIEQILEALEPHPNVEELIIDKYRGAHFPLWMGDSILTNMVSIALLDCRKLLILPAFGQLASLQKLMIHRMDYVEYIDNDFPGEGRLEDSRLWKTSVLWICRI